jgi:hypothetical protein
LRKKWYRYLGIKDERQVKAIAAKKRGFSQNAFHIILVSMIPIKIFVFVLLYYVPSLLKFKYRKGADRESSPCQYTYSSLLTTQAFNIRLNFSCPLGLDSSSSYWWHLGISTSI